MGNANQERTGEFSLSSSIKTDGAWHKVRRIKKTEIPQNGVSSNKCNCKRSAENLMIPERSKKLESYIAHKTIPGLYIENKYSKAQKKRAAKNTAQKKRNQSESDEIHDFQINDNIHEDLAEREQGAGLSAKEKKLRNLRKRLREVETLEIKIKNGEVKKPEPEQLEKVGRKIDLMLQIEQLEDSAF